MLIDGTPLMEKLLAQPHFEAKCILNETGIVFFAVRQQHRDVKFAGLNYDDDYRGNALAAMVKPGALEVRFHRDFSDNRVRLIWTSLQVEPAVAFLRGWKITYQGRDLT